MLLFRPETSEIFWQPIMQKIWDCRIKKLICASNDNKVLYDFFRTGAYDRNRDFILTTSPSMDILISSNLERLIYRIAGEDAACNASLMAALAGDGKYEITAEMKEKLGDFYGNYATARRNARQQIRSLYEDTDYVLDPHTAVAAAVYNKYKEETGDTTKDCDRIYCKSV